MKASHILVVDDEADIRSLVQEILVEEGYEVTTAANGSAARSARAARRPDLVLLDIWMPDVDGITLLREWSREEGGAGPVVMMSGHGTVDTAVEATRLGALDFIEKPLSLSKLLRTVESALDQSRRGKRRAPLAAQLEPVGKSAPVQALREQLKRVAGHDTPVLLTGEAGTGRETLARHLHAQSRQAARPFVNLPLGSLQDADAVAELCGVEGGVAGWFEQADDGTLFLNELGDLGAEAQRVLFAALEAREFTRLGSAERLPLRCRVIASAQPDLAARVERGHFRRDLYNHLDVMQLRVPPLRDYREDVPELLRYYTDLLVDAEQLKYRRFSIAAQNRLRNYPWPGNVRELRNLVHKLLLLGGAEEISLEEVEAIIQRDMTWQPEPLVKQDLLSMPLREAREHFERAYLEQQLQLAGGKVGKLAERVGMERTHLYRKLRQLGIEIGGDREED